MVRVGRPGHVAALWACAYAIAATLGACLPGPLDLAPGDGGLSSDGPPGDSATGGEAGPGSDSGALIDAPGAGDTSTGADSSVGSDACTTGCSPPGCACIDPVPSGWTLVAFDATSRTSCPGGYGVPTDVIVDPSHLGPSACSCTCDVATLPSCTTGQVSIEYGTGVCNTAAGPYPVNGGGCVATSIPFAAANHSMAPLPPTGGTCTPQVMNTPPSPGGGLGKQCTVSAVLGSGGCSGSKVCAPPASSLFDLCIAQSGQVACPSGYPHAHATGTGITPGGCSQCTCAMPMTACNSPTFTLYSDTTCSTTLAKLVADGSCQAVTTGGTTASYIYTATPSTTCVPPSQPTPTGNSSLSGLTTVCCP